MSLELPSCQFDSIAEPFAVVSQRTKEIGVRLALGATPREVAGMIVRQGGLVTLAGLGAGFVAAVAGSRLLEALLDDVNPRDPVVFCCRDDRDVCGGDGRLCRPAARRVSIH